METNIFSADEEVYMEIKKLSADEEAIEWK